MSEAVDRAARAMALSSGLEWDELPDEVLGNGEDRNWFRGLARAALDTIAGGQASKRVLYQTVDGKKFDIRVAAYAVPELYITVAVDEVA